MPECSTRSYNRTCVYLVRLHNVSRYSPYDNLPCITEAEVCHTSFLTPIREKAHNTTVWLKFWCRLWTQACAVEISSTLPFIPYRVSHWVYRFHVQRPWRSVCGQCVRSLDYPVVCLVMSTEPSVVLSFYPYIHVVDKTLPGQLSPSQV